MSRERDVSRGRGFALVELAAIVGIGGVLIALLVLGGAGARRQARLGECTVNLKEFGAATESYAQDNADRIWGFSWRKGDMLSQYPDLNNNFSDLQAGANQAVDILRRRGGRTDIAPISGWIPQILYSHLVLSDYLDSELPQRYGACPEDTNRLCWQEDPLTYCQRCSPAPLDCGSNNSKRWPYSSSYYLTAAFFAPDSGMTITQGQSHNQYVVPGNVVLGGRLLSEVAHPSQKVMMFETHARHFRPRIAYYAYEEARAAMLLVDGSVSTRVTADSNDGWRPDQPGSPFPTIFSYTPSNWEPPALSGAQVIGHSMWTRRGLGGRDYGGPEVP